MRTVICHYHIYKNAGTSFDHVLRHSFGDRLLAFDGPFPFFTIDQEQLDRIILRKSEAVAFSSHQIQLPAPESASYSLIPVVFLRHPLLRIASVWRFKRGEVDGTETARLAARHDFPEWLARCFADPQEIAQVSNAQTRLLSAAYRQRAWMRRHPDRMEYDFSTAKANLKNVTCLGRTEHFAADVARFAGVMAARGLALQVPDSARRNVTDPSTDPVDLRVERLLDGLTPAMRQRLIGANEQDQALYDTACEVAVQDGAAA